MLEVASEKHETESVKYISSHASYLIAPLTSVERVKNKLRTYFNYLVQSGPKIKR